MNKRYLIIFLIVVNAINHAIAHDANAAFFSIEQNEEGFLVKAEFPWSLRDGLIEFNQALENKKPNLPLRKPSLTTSSKTLYLWTKEDSN